MNNKFSVKQTIQGKFIFSRNSTSNEKVDVFLKEKSNKKDIHLITTSNDKFEIKLDNLENRPFFLIKSIDNEYIVAERTLLVDGMINFRDMGGFETYDGHTVKWGLLYRSDHIYNTTETGLEYLRK